MYEIIRLDSASVTSTINGLISGSASEASADSRFILVKATPSADGSWDWIDAMHHDLAGALRSMRYLAQRAKAAYDPSDARGGKILASIDKHLATLDHYKVDLVEALFPPEG